MRKIILNLAVTLDGFIEGPNGEVDWCQFDSSATNDSGIESHFDTFLSNIDVIFYGRVSYEMWGQYQPTADAPLAEKKLWHAVHSKEKYVFSSSSKNTDDGKAIVISDDIESRVNEIRKKGGKNIWLYGGAGLIRTFMELDLIDQYLLAIYPVILGNGKPLFHELRDRRYLTLNGVTPSASGVVLMDYERK